MKKYKPLILFLFIVFFLYNESIGINYNPFTSKTTTIKLLLLDNWRLSEDNSNSSRIVTIPYFVSDKNVISVNFKRNFSISDTIDYSKIRLWINGLHGFAYIYLNNQLLKDHLNIASTYYIDIKPSALKKENNTLDIRLEKLDNNGKTHDLRLPNYPKQLRPLGIAREIYIEYLPKKFLDKINIKYNNRSINFNYELNITDSSKNVIEKTIKIEEQILSPDGNTFFKRFEYYKNKKTKKSINRKVNIRFPEEWASDSPRLYNLILNIKSGTSNYFRYEKKFGLREVSARNNQILLNHKPINIKGINYRYNFISGLTYLNQSRLDLTSIKNAGYNAVRFVNYPPHPSIASFADSIGLYLFIDNGMWRLPSSYFNNNKYFNEGKELIKEIGETFNLYSSVLGIGIGNEPNIFLPNEKKFTIVLKKYINDNYNFLTYITPLDYSENSPNKFCDFLLLNNYVNPEKLFYRAQSNSKQNIPMILGNIHFPETIEETDGKDNSQELTKLKRFFAHYDSLNIFSGYFIESYNDWKGELPNFHTKIDDSSNFIYPFGIVDLERNKKEKYYFFTDYLKNNDIDVMYYKNIYKNNFQSLSVFIVAIIFFLIYKRNYRLKENLTRSLQHPYGFFVDLRDRRIISVFNSTLMGITVGTIISSFLSSIIYALNTSILFDEYVNIFIPQIHYKLLFLSIVESPWKIFFLILISLSFLQILFVVLIKIITIFSKEKRKFRQIYSIISWSGSPLLFFIPISIFAYNFIINDILFPEIVWIFLLFLVWYNFRMANGLRVLYMIQPINMIIFVFLTYLVLIISFLVYINMDIAVIEYIKTLSAAQNLY